ncbi:hypothetical protein IWW50_006028, partial [Coemansia erecta]
VPLSEDISTAAVPADKAAARFRAASGDGDPKSLMARYQQSLFRTLQLESLSGDLAVLSTSSQLAETTEQRLRRLVYETQELREQMAQESSKRADAGKPQSVSLMRLMGGLHDELSQLSKQCMADESGAESAGKVEGRPQLSQRVQAQAKGVDTAEIELRVAGLEKLVGAAQLKDTSAGKGAGRNLVDSVSQLQQQMDVLADPQRVEGIQRRVKQVLLDLSQLEQANKQASLAAASSGEGQAQLDPHTIKQIDELYQKLAQVDSLIELAPATAQRLHSLAQLHAEAAEAVARVGHVESEQGSISEELTMMKEVAQGLQVSIQENETMVKANVGHLDARIAALNDRLAALA